MANKTVAAVVKLIDQFSSPSKEVNTAAKNMEKRFKQTGDKFKAVGKVFESVGSSLTKTVTAPLMAVGGASLAAFDEVDSALDTITKKTGATGEAMDEFQKVFENVATNVPADMSDVSNAVGEINTRLGLTGKPLEEASEQFIKFAQLNGSDVNTSIQLVSRAMGDAGIAAEDYGKILDELNVAGQMSGISVDNLAESLAKYGAPMRALGIDTETSIAMFAGWEKAGVNTQIAFSGMKTAISNWGKQGKDSGKEFSKVMQQIKDAPDIASATSLAIETFGSKAGPDLADAIRGGRFEVEDYVKALENAGGSVNNTFEGTQDGIDKFKTASNAAKIALSDFGEVISNAVAPYVDKVTKLIKKATEWFRNLSPEAQKSIVEFAGIAAAAGPVLIAFGKISTGIGALTGDTGLLTKGIMKLTGSQTGFGALTKMFKPLTAVMKSPITMFKTLATTIRHPITSIKSLGTVLTKPVSLFKSLGSVIAHPTQLLKMFGTVIKSPIKSVGMLGTKFVSFTNAVGPVPVALGVIAALAVLIYKNWDKIGPIVKKIADRFVEFWETVQPKLQPLLDKFKEIADFLVGAFNVAFETAGGYLTSFFESGAELIDNFLGMLEGIIDFLSGVFTGNWEQAWEGLKKVVSNAFGALEGLVKMPLNAVIGLVNGAIDGINSINFTVPEWVPGIGGKGWQGLGIPHIPTLASGTDNWKGGIAQISERGGEIVDLPSGSRVYPHDESVQKAREEGKKTINITLAKLADQIVVREDADIDRIASAIAKKIEQTAVNMA